MNDKNHKIQFNLAFIIKNKDLNILMKSFFSF